MLKKTGKVWLVGAGPGDPGLLTIKALRALETADAVVYDRLVSREVLELVPAGATLISVGKSPANHPVPQEDINQLLIRLARAGRQVVRLKGGDPFIFGRGSEEAMELVAHGLEIEVIPGITAAQGCSASVGVPLTHRGLATGVRYLTGHCRQDGELDFDWDGLSDPDTTLVIYMGLANINQIVRRLITSGLRASTPAIAISCGTTPKQQQLVTTLQLLPSAAKAAEFAGPVLFIVGRVASLHGKLGVRVDNAVMELSDAAPV
jgi:uroporphyrin-III C-methyltransferase